MGPGVSRFVFANESNPSTHLKFEKDPTELDIASKKAEIDYFPFYNLRAAFASRLMAYNRWPTFRHQL